MQFLFSFFLLTDNLCSHHAYAKMTQNQCKNSHSLYVTKKKEKKEREDNLKELQLPIVQHVLFNTAIERKKRLMNIQ